MARPILDDDLWNVIEPLLPAPKRRRFRFPGRKPVEHRAALTGILFVLRTGIPWEYLPQELGCGSGMTCWRRLHAWQKRGVWDKVHRVLLDRLQEAKKIDWSRAAVDSSSLRAVGGATKPVLIPRTDARKGPSTTSLRMQTAFPSRPASPQRTATMSPN
jgi:transposase